MARTALLRYFNEAPDPAWRTAPPPSAPLPPLPAVNPWDDTALGVSVGLDETGQHDGGDVTIAAADRCEHTLLLGKTGQGKSNMLLQMIAQDARAGRGCCVLDAHGKLVEDALATIPFWREDDVILLDCADDDWPFGLNFFQSPVGATPREKAQLIDQVLQAFAKGWGGGWAGSAETWLKVCAWTFMENRCGTMAMIPRLLTDREYRAAFLSRIQDIATRDRWAAAINPKTGAARIDNLEPILTRLYKFLGNPLVANIVGQEKTTLDFDRWMADGKIVLIKLPEGGKYGIGKEAVGLLGTMLLQLIVQAGYGRAEGSVLWPVYLDEFQHYATPDIPEILQNLRKYGVGCVLSTQSFANVGDEAIRDRLMGAGSVICYQVTEKDARVVAGAFRHGLRLPEDWREEVTRHGAGPYRYETREMIYHRPSKAEIADRLANLRTLVGIGRSLVRTNEGEYVVATPNMAREPGGDPRLIASRSLVVRRSRSRYCRPRHLVEREMRRALLPDAKRTGEGDADCFADVHPVEASPAVSPAQAPAVTRRRQRLSPDDRGDTPE
ncbi:MAG: type IV secretion system DNA-binding domain-containing protein [Chloroflexota bacterium]|nr:type IV secretion system DNA-binding domain-containing protein [Chloroflexota bacterium]